MTEWFEQWFGEEYLKLYPHRDEEDAAAAVSLITAWVPLDTRRVLDLACGPGRHAKLIRAAGGQVVGFDLSMPLLSRARHRMMPPLTVVRGDMRHLPFTCAAFDVVVNLFTSFGYFADDSQHRAVLLETAEVLTGGGRLVLDYFNSQMLLANLVQREEREIGRQRVVIERSLSQDARFVLKEMHLMDDGRRFLERVRLFTPGELEALVTEAGLEVEQCLGDYDGSPFAGDSPRVIVFAKKP
ncbi:MAG: class I SAM-dependent methyltransferase [Gemmatimonadota bacterium]|nr:MAG: class I SAM-dependent methyltransferase [Gemmatimonadota bacterium]